MSSTITLKLNLSPGQAPGGIMPRLHVSQGDNTDRLVAFELYDGATTADLSNATSVYFGGTKSDGNGFTVSCSVSGNTATAALTAQSTALSGEIDCKLYVVSSTGSYRSATFVMEVDPDPLVGSAESGSDMSIVIDLAQSYVDAAGRSATAAATSATAATNSATSAANSATSAANSATAAAASVADSVSLITSYITDSEAWAVGRRDGVEVASNDETYQNNAKYYADQCAAAVGVINGYTAIINAIIGTMYITDENGNQLITEDGNYIVMDY